MKNQKNMQKIMFNDKFGLTKAVLEGKKTQTRRIIPESWLEGLEEFQEEYFNDTLDHIEGTDLLEQYFLIEQRKKPHFAVGEILAVAQSYKSIYDDGYVRPAEEFLTPQIRIKNIDSLLEKAKSSVVYDICNTQDHSEIVFKRASSNEIVKIPGIFGRMAKAEEQKEKILEIYKDTMCFTKEYKPGWSNKMFVKAEFMPYQIRITNIRLQRIQDISDEDCLKEGIQKCSEDHRIGYPIGVPFNYFICEDKKGNRYTTPKEAYAALIDKISGKGTWNKNPWVFVYDFELVK